jgi:RNA polymerase subunit RPABC4/transcription elongation factor Spt4
MAKPHRGKGTRELYAHGRGECPVCKRYNVKVLYELEAEGQKFKVCKVCKAAIKNGTKKLPVVASPAAPAETKTETAKAAPAAEAPAEEAAAPAAETAEE